MYKYLIAMSFWIFFNGLNCQNCNTRFVRAADSDYFPPENVSNTIFIPDASVCTANCYRFKHCIAVSFNQTSGLCHMFTTYKTSTNGSNEASGSVFFTLESLCGPSEISLPMEYWRDGVITTSHVSCNETTVFFGTNDTSVCTSPSTSWSSATVDCVENAMPFDLSGLFLRVVDSKLTIVGIPTGESFHITLSDQTHDYLLKIHVYMDTNIMDRYSRIAGVWYKAPDPLSIPFPFSPNTIFTMEVVSSVAQFECKVNGQQAFTFEHQKPRDSAYKIRIGDNVHLKKVTTT